MKHDIQLQAVLYAIQQYPSIDRTKLNKFVFFVDLIHYNKYKDTLLEDEYIRMPFGPVPSYIYPLSLLSNFHFETHKRCIDEQSYWFEYELKQEPNLEDISESSIELMDSVISLLKCQRTNEISKLSHKYDLWKNVANYDIIPLNLFTLEENEFVDLLMEIAYGCACEIAGPLDSSNDNPVYKETVDSLYAHLQLDQLKVV